MKEGGEDGKGNGCVVTFLMFGFLVETMVEFFVGFLLDRKCLFCFVLFSCAGGCCNSMVLEEGLVKDFSREEGGEDEVFWRKQFERRKYLPSF